MGVSGVSEPIWATGGPGGERAVTEDLEWAVAALRHAAERVARARHELARRSAALELGGVAPAGLAAELRSLAITAAPGVEAELDDTASRLAAVGLAYLEAERQARHSVGLVDAGRAALADAWHGGVWMARAAVVAGAASVPGGLRAVWGIVPTGPPPTTATLTRDGVEAALAKTPYHALVAAIESILTLSSARALTRWSGWPVGTSRRAEPATSLEDIMRGLTAIDAAGSGEVRIERWTGADGVTRRIVYIPGTRDWLNVSGNPSDLHADVALMAGHLPDAAAMVVAALEADGAERGEPVMLVGHSLGGIVATALAGNQCIADRFTVKAVMTAGAPTGRIALPRSVNALHLEGTRDIVPGLDAAPNPDTPTRVTVHHDARDSELPQLAGEGEDISSAHHLDTYTQTARLIDAGANPSSDAWLAAEREFLAPGKRVSVTDYRP